MPKILILANHRKGRSPGQRFRFEQYLDMLEQNGFEITFSNFIDETDDKNFYAPGNYFGKIGILIKNILIRTKESLFASRYDIVFIYREATMIGSSFFERWMAKSKAKLIFDYDDSIWLPNVSEGNKALAFLKRPEKTKEIISVCDVVFAGNEYLKQYALQYCKDVVVVPTTIDTSYHVPQKTQKEKVCIGWTGTQTTIPHFLSIQKALEIVFQKYPDRVYFKLIAEKNIEIPELNLRTTLWNKQDEIAQLSEIDIGIMPLPDDQWTRGKCGFKGLQFMSLGVPTVMSPVGVNNDIIMHGENGFLASTEQEWISLLSVLIENRSLREQLGQQGKKTIETNYSVIANEQKYLDQMKRIAKMTKQ
ncbi:MAG: glycosyltransferase family 4 protein [Chitinophagales bacterium]|nr:glycosyltransferase family 4 protein [Chitinophagales bacterium]